MILYFLNLAKHVGEEVSNTPCSRVPWLVGIASQFLSSLPGQRCNST